MKNHPDLSRAFILREPWMDNDYNFQIEFYRYETVSEYKHRLSKEKLRKIEEFKDTKKVISNLPFLSNEEKDIILTKLENFKKEL